MAAGLPAVAYLRELGIAGIVAFLLQANALERILCVQDWAHAAFAGVSLTPVDLTLAKLGCVCEPHLARWLRSYS